MMVKVSGKRLILILLLSLLSSCSRDKVIQEGKIVPDFSLRDTSGNNVRLSDLRGKVVLIEFWATWCEACREAVPDLIEIYKNNKEKDFEFLAVSVDEGPEAKDRVVQFIKEYNIPYRVAINGTTISNRFGVYTIPSIFIINKEGILVKRYPGYFPDMAVRVDKEIKGLL
jgi:cytochrome c biogenesis protein CcmG/thiol:disulfide interchange protein DsbE